MRTPPKKRLPKLESLLAKRKTHKHQTPQEMLAMVKMLNAAFGGSVIENPVKQKD